MNHVLASLAVLAFFSLKNINGQNSRSCNSCDDPNSGATWGELRVVGICQGQCDVARRNISKTCIFPNNETILCKFVKPCTNEISCNGMWGDWGSYGNCNSTCGPGFQRRTRSCYDKVLLQNRIKPRYVVSSFCRNGKGFSVQHKFISCSRQKCSNSSTLHTTRPTTATSPVPTTNQDKSDFSVDENRTPAGEANEFEDKAWLKKSQSNSSNRQVDVLTLTAVLGSIAVLSVVVSVVLITVKRRKKQKENTRSSTSSSTSSRREQDDDTNQYEIIEPNLPRSRCYSETRLPSHRNAQNILYNPYPRLQNGDANQCEITEATVPRNRCFSETRFPTSVNGHNILYSRYPYGRTLNSNRNYTQGTYLQPILSPSTLCIKETETSDPNDPNDPTYATISVNMH